nr:putative ribonuclease H-like domain-containing protein [Tanacetum cinerariifolium]
MKRCGFKQSNSVHTLFLKNRKNHVTCLIIYVDDMVFIGNDEEELKRLKEGLFTEFEMKDLGNLKYFLGIEVLRSPKRIFICQKKYILDLLAEIGMINCKLADTPMMVSQKHCIYCWSGKSVHAPTTACSHECSLKNCQHVEVDRHFIKEKLEAGIIKLPFVKSSDQLVDILTKAVGTNICHKHYNINGFPQRHSGVSPATCRWGYLTPATCRRGNVAGEG